MIRVPAGQARNTSNAAASPPCIDELAVCDLPTPASRDRNVRVSTLDYALQAALSEFYPGPMATGENLFSHQDARNLLRYGGMRPDRDWLMKRYGEAAELPEAK